MSPSTRTSLHDLIEELGFPPSEHQFLLRLFGSSDPFAGLPPDLEASHSQDQSRQLSSTSLARRLASTRLCERANHFRLQSFQHRPSDFPEDSEGRDLVHYEEEWTSLIGADSESLLSELFQQLATDDEPPCLESPELPEHHKTSENVTRPGSVEPPCSSVYDSEKAVISNPRPAYLGFPDSLKIWWTATRSENKSLPESVPKRIHLHSITVGYQLVLLESPGRVLTTLQPSSTLGRFPLRSLHRPPALAESCLSPTITRDNKWISKPPTRLRSAQIRKNTPFSPHTPLGSVRSAT
ncbi:hypothetical protein DTO006G1_8616 [Penicillium roqueforti]|uniref:uncharacterized protein n=1 Tax=Penicillium roqueforti TaxID=5082 RepID=UPI00190AD1F5|nr:uncharacterized protein LCP9604111_5806 [Penicillium roqueforti]KAF9248097.1 hypothetical protein LCP9604111_5806 [Penicillium roqueforti]KAI1830189.1 hypothetical protein CBS147337_8974 [Penicillium roqueforti]KAI2714777.1 hypothetical protein CBS147318_6354 [Penicillium roqueforti]KAI2754460.1 hypothetical protein DTO006G1_8616 [Penicillium roqueforti]KAI3128068.1 hypothetical protein CBS147330_5527 [Penicillium roqueforti]